MLKIVVDEDMPRSTTQLFQSMGFETLDVRDVGLKGRSDDEIFAFAQREQAVIVTGDLGFGNILRYPLGSHAGIIVVHYPNEVSNSEINNKIREACSSLSEDEIKGSLLILEPGKIRRKRPI
jgi:predicted nuclease of predicted toxin-antitoxin system